jgi:hypothetical protein
MTQGKVRHKISFGALGKRNLCRFRAVMEPARVLWCNFELARELGFSVPRENRLDERLEREMVKAFSFRASQPGERTRGRPTVNLYADRYYGAGMADHFGSARGGITPSFDVFIKGLGRTPLARAGNPRHSNGVCHLLQCVAEAVFGELDAHLFGAGSTRVIAILDQDRTVVIDGKRCHAALVARVGVPFRPAHLVRRLEEDLRDIPSLFARLTRLGGILATRGNQPDLGRTMRRILKLHARTAAEQVRWRVLHGAISTSNLGLFGEMLDLNSQSTQARTAPISIQRGRRSRSHSFGGEHLARGQELRLMYLSVTESLSRRRRVELGAEDFDCEAEFQAMYVDELEKQLLRATGFKANAADAIKRDHPDMVRRYCEVLQKLMVLRNPGSLNARISTCESVGVVDVFRVLALFPRKFFAMPGADQRSTVRALADLRLSGERSRRARVHSRAVKLLDALAGLYREVMTAARHHEHHYAGGWSAMKVSICERAEFENQPLCDYYRARFLSDISALERVEAISSQARSRALQVFIDTRVARNARNVDAMLGRDVTRDDDGFAVQRRVLDDVEHVLRSRDGVDWRIEISIGGPVIPSFFHFSFDGSSWRAVPVNESDGRGRAVIRPVVRYGVLEGGFSLHKRRSTQFEKVLPFAFALPDSDQT